MQLSNCSKSRQEFCENVYQSKFGSDIPALVANGCFIFLWCCHLTAAHSIQHWLITVHYSAKDTAVLPMWRIWPYNSAGFSTRGPTSGLHKGTILSKLLPLNCQQEGSVLHFFFATVSQLFEWNSVSFPPHALTVLLSLPHHCFCSAVSQKPVSSFPHRLHYPKRKKKINNLTYLICADKSVNLFEVPGQIKCLGWIMSNWRL